MPILNKSFEGAFSLSGREPAVARRLLPNMDEAPAINNPALAFFTKLLRDVIV
jgi:hypothetical protein